MNISSANLYKIWSIYNIIFVISTCFQKKRSWFKVLKLNILIDKNICVPLKMQIYISHFVFRRQSAEFFFSNKICWMKASQNNKYDISRYKDFRVLFRFNRQINFTISMSQKFVNELDLIKMHHCAMLARVMPTLHKSPRAGESVKVYFHSVGPCQPYPPF